MVHLGVSVWEVSTLTWGVIKQWLQCTLVWKLQVSFPGLWKHFQCLTSWRGSRVCFPSSSPPPSFLCGPLLRLLPLGVWMLQLVLNSANQVGTDACWKNELKPGLWHWDTELLWWTPEPGRVIPGSHSLRYVSLLISFAVSCSRILPARGTPPWL